MVSDSNAFNSPNPEYESSTMQSPLEHHGTTVTSDIHESHTIRGMPNTILPNTKYDHNAKHLPSTVHSKLNKEFKDVLPEVKKPQKPSIAVSTIWHMPKSLSNTNTNKENSQYILDLIRSSKNFEFGTIDL